MCAVSCDGALCGVDHLRLKPKDGSDPVRASGVRGVRLLLALSGHSTVGLQCPLLGVKQTSHLRTRMSAFDPKRTSVLGFRDFNLYTRAHLKRGMQQGSQIRFGRLERL
jgi:hypothetical protein